MSEVLAFSACKPSWVMARRQSLSICMLPWLMAGLCPRDLVLLRLPLVGHGVVGFSLLGHGLVFCTMHPLIPLSPRKLHPVFHLKGGICVQKKYEQFPRVSTQELRITKRRNLKYFF